MGGPTQGTFGGTGTRALNRRIRMKGGLAQAAADLKQARQNADPEKIAAAGEIARAGEKVRRGVKLYEKTHQSLIGFYDELLQKIGAFLSKWGELVMAVEPDGVAVDQVTVYSAERLEDNYFFELYQSGIRQLTFLPGMTREEMETFFQTLERASQGKEGAEDDFVTLLWEQELDHIGYVMIETFSENDEDEDREAQQRIEEVKGMVNLAMVKDLQATQARMTKTGTRDPLTRQFTIRLTNADVHFLKAENLTVLDDVPAIPRDEDLGDLYSIDAEVVARLAEETRSDPFTVEKYFDSLVRSLTPGSEARDLAQIVKLVGVFVEAVAATKSFARAAEIIRLIRPLLPSGDEGDATITRALLDALASDKICDCLIAAVARDGDEKIVAEALDLASALPRAGAGKLIDRLDKIGDRRRRRALCDVLAKFGQPALEAAARAQAKAGEDVALDLLYLFKVVGGARAADLLDGATRHPVAHVRFEALRYYLQVCEPAQSYLRARSAARDDDPAVRRIAVEHLQHVRTQAAADVLRELIEADEFGARDFGEKKRMFLAYASLTGQPGIPYFRERLGRRNLLARGDVDEERAAAAAALGFLRDAGSRAALAKLAGSVLTRALVKHECEQAIALIDAPAPKVAEPATPRMEIVHSERPAFGQAPVASNAPVARVAPAAVPIPGVGSAPVAAPVRVPSPSSSSSSPSSSPAAPPGRSTPSAYGAEAPDLDPASPRFAAASQTLSPLTNLRATGDDEETIDRPAVVRVDMSLRRAMQAQAALQAAQAAQARGTPPVVSTPPAAPPVVSIPPAAPPVVSIPPAAPPVVSIPPAAPPVVSIPPAAPPVVSIPPAAPPAMVHTPPIGAHTPPAPPPAPTMAAPLPPREPQLTPTGISALLRDYIADPQVERSPPLERAPEEPKSNLDDLLRDYLGDEDD